MLHELVRAGKVRHGGLSNHPPELVERALAVGPVAALQHQLSLLRRETERDVLPFAVRHGLGVAAACFPIRLNYDAGTASVRISARVTRASFSRSSIKVPIRCVAARTRCRESRPASSSRAA